MYVGWEGEHYHSNHSCSHGESKLSITPTGLKSADLQTPLNFLAICLQRYGLFSLFTVKEQ